MDLISLSYGGIISRMKKNNELSQNSNQLVSSQSLHLDKDWLYQKYIVEGLSTYDIGKIVGRNPKNVYNKLKDFGIPTRTRAEEVVKHSWWNLGLEHAGKGKQRSEEAKEKISKARTGQAGVKGEKNGMFGKRSPNWKGGTTPARQLLYGTLEWKETVRLVFERDNYICRRCGKQNRDLHTHHIKSWAECVEGRTDISNLITVCKGCHHWIHSKKNTSMDFLG